MPLWYLYLKVTCAAVSELALESTGLYLYTFAGWLYLFPLPIVPFHVEMGYQLGSLLVSALPEPAAWPCSVE